MIARLVAVLTLVSFVSIGASAQKYYIRVNNNTNLREAASLTARIVETVPTGTILQVLGNSGRWLQSSRNGSQVWMADWVSYVRVENSSQTQSQSQIDNCCFVDRQCVSKQEWTDGYWAFQNGQCVVPTQSQPEVSVPPVSNTPAIVDNCCGIDRQCNADAEWTEGYWAFQRNACPVATSGHAPAVAAGRPIIEGAEVFVRRVNNALDWLERRAPAWYAYVINGMSKIGQSPHYGASFARLAERATYVSQSHAFRGEGRIVDYMILCSTLVHEASHHYDHAAGLAIAGWEGEIRAERKQLEFYRDVDPYGQYEAINYLKRGLVNGIISMERGWLSSQTVQEVNERMGLP